MLYMISPFMRKMLHETSRIIGNNYLNMREIEIDNITNNKNHQTLIFCFRTYLWCGVRNFHASPTVCDLKIVKTPQFPDSVAEGDVRWEKKKGDHVQEDEVVLEIETDKTSLPVPAPGNGIIMETFVENGGTVRPGQDLFSIDITGIIPVRKPAPPKLVPKK